MSLPQTRAGDRAGQAAWTRELARDLFPAAVTPFHWTLLQHPAQMAMRRAWADLGAALPDADFWRRGQDGRVYLNADLVGQAGCALHGAAWLAAPPESKEAGLLDRLRAQGTIRRVQAQIVGVAQEIADLQTRLAGWLAWVQRLRWTQADLLQVMEELEPQAQRVLRAYFIARAGLSAAQADVAGQLGGWWPACPPGVVLSLYAGLDGLPSVEAAYALAALGQAPDRAAALHEFLARYGHRGPGEAEPDARRWGDRPDRVLALAALPAARDAAQARAARDAAERVLQERLGGGRWRQIEPGLTQARDLCRAADLAWDGFVHVMAAAQAWLRAVAVEARSAGLIAEVTEVSYLELEELKQVATGEWHGGRSELVRAEVARRRAERASAPAEQPRPPRPASPGKARGPIFRPAATAAPTLFAQAIVLADVADPGQAPCWLSAAGLLDAAGDPWSPGMIAGRALAVPAVSGLAPEVWQAASGQMVVMDAGAGRAALAW